MSVLIAPLARNRVADFQLICWDFVSEPSTPGAFMMREAKEVSPQFINNVFNKTDRIDRIFNDIMEWK